jgi:hypothetical protein
MVKFLGEKHSGRMFRLPSIKFETAGNSTLDTDNICFIFNFNNDSNI